MLTHKLRVKTNNDKDRNSWHQSGQVNSHLAFKSTWRDDYKQHTKQLLIVQLYLVGQKQHNFNVSLILPDTDGLMLKTVWAT